ncbi:hypothetical protein ACFL6U_03730 [Planctomycetota bacterium]
MCKGRYLGKDRHGYGYYSNPDGYVYQWQGGECLGWLCSYVAWERTLHKIVQKPQTSGFCVPITPVSVG